MDQEAGEEEDGEVAVGQEDQLDGFPENVSSQWNNNGDVNWDLSDTSEAGENDFYIDDSEPADLEGLMVVYEQFQYKDKDNDLQSELNDDNEVDFNFEESELEFSYEPGISLASLATCACPCLRHHETGHCQNCILDGTKGWNMLTKRCISICTRALHVYQWKVTTLEALC